MTNSPDGTPPLSRPVPSDPLPVDEVAAGDPSPPVGESAPEPAMHHGEALVAALLNTRRDSQTREFSADGSAVTEPGRTAPLTASSFMNSTTGDGVVSTGGGPLDPLARSRILSDSVPPESVVSEPVQHFGIEGSTPPEPEVASDGADGAGGGDDSGDDNGEGKDVEQTFARNVLEWIVVLGAAVVVAIILRTFVFQAFYIPSESMETTLFTDDRLLVNKVSYRLHDVNRGDVVVFRRPDDQPGAIRDLIKRVIGLPGDTVEGRDGIIYISGQQLVEPYLDGNPFGDFAPVTVPEGEFFMMGDNRDESLDSRRFGTIGEDRIIGRAFVLFWPFDRIGTL